MEPAKRGNWFVATLVHQKEEGLCINFGYGVKRSATRFEHRRFDLRGISQADSVRTFDRKKDALHGSLGIEEGSGEATQLVGSNDYCYIIEQTELEIYLIANYNQLDELD